MMEMLQVGLMC